MAFDIQGASAESFIVDLDHAVLLWEEQLFTDGFESGDTSAWVN